MKTNAPEKLYIFNPEKREAWFSKTSDKQVEYTRTDAFIEKALMFIKENIDKYSYRAYDIMNGFEVTDISEDFDEDFKNYMKV